VPGALRAEVADELQQLTERLAQVDFYRHGTDYASLLTNIQSRVREAALQQGKNQAQRLKNGVEDLQRAHRLGRADPGRARQCHRQDRRPGA
jgi:hypothetical protein